ncbi:MULTISPECIES: cytochrome c oxidase assembly factor CtaG [unclassified Paenibacillus]|uniref:cytochrome c oxidase assembly factor CtaG n=1 Tax=unclassified Paenibacillus TaxID=185978 RepID=UPI001C114B04|nr:MULTISPECIES: cytochrome c oxidase assembly factor CtaG [unclassified Paenibacillus]MBU5441046.1 cytochrome c oxidase assembly factor CtaG [Paenibacillus sp. MSJ-34]CAH0117964.1 hypothetical protein PAE9249_00429 [Paenibacillus sp. CECT 9249]
MLGLEYFSFSDLWSPLFLGFMLLATIAYLMAVGPMRHRFADSDKISLAKKISFVTGMVLLYVAQGGPISFLSHMMFSFHMVAMALSYIIAPPLLLMGTPAWLWRAILKYNPLRKFGFLMNPIFAAVLFNVLFSLYHVPAVHDYVMLNFTVHRLYYIALFITSMMMWWPLLCPVPEWNNMSDVKKMGYIFLNSVLITPACGLIIFAGAPVYATYNDPEIWSQAMGYCFSGDPAVLLELYEGPAFFNLFTPLEDQQIGGIAMKLIQEFVNGSVLAYVFIHWFKRESKDDDIMDVIPETGQLNKA